MTQGIVVTIRQGKTNPDAMYIQLRNKAVWVYTGNLTPSELVERISAFKGKKMPLAGFTLARPAK